MFRRHDRDLLVDLVDRVKGLEHDAELMRTVLIVKEPNSVAAAESYEGLRKQIVAGAAERRSHLNQLVAMSVAVTRATSVHDLRTIVSEWMQQAGVLAVSDVPAGSRVTDLFEDLGRTGLEVADKVEVVEPAYVDAQTGALLRLGRARAVSSRVGSPAEAAAPSEPISEPLPPVDGGSNFPTVQDRED